jgi:hypothetical protein
MVQKIRVDISNEDCKAIASLLMVSTFDMFIDKPTSRAIVSILAQLVKKFQSAHFSNRGVKELLPHEGWALSKALGSITFNLHSYEFNMTRSLLDKIHKQLI